MLSAPSVIPPVSPCSQGVSVSGTVPDATVEIFVDRNLVAKGPSSAGNSFIPLVPGVRLDPRDLLVARQYTATDASDRSRDAVGVLAEPSFEDLRDLFCPFGGQELGLMRWCTL